MAESEDGCRKFLPIFLVVGALLAPHVISFILMRREIGISLYEGVVPLLGYWATVFMVYITWLYVTTTRSILAQAQRQAEASSEQSRATNAMLQASAQDRLEKFKPILVPLTDLRTLSNKTGKSSFAGVPICIENIGNAAALNIAVNADFLGTCASSSPQPFKVPHLATGDHILLGDLTNAGNTTMSVALNKLHVRITCSDILGTPYTFECTDGVMTQKIGL